jgi:hypothetical protein
MKEEYIDDDYKFKKSDVYDVYDINKDYYYFIHPNRKILISLPREKCKEISDFNEIFSELVETYRQYSHILDVVFSKNIEDDIEYIEDSIQIGYFKNESVGKKRFNMSNIYNALEKYETDFENSDIEVELRNFDIEKDVMPAEKLLKEFENKLKEFKNESSSYIFLTLHFTRKETIGEYFSRKMTEAKNKLMEFQSDDEYKDFIKLSKKYLPGVI